MSDVVHVDDSNFESEVVNSTLPVIVDFSATWCGPCQRQVPILEKYATANVSRVKVCKVDIDDSPGITSKFGIRGVPTLMVFNNGKSVGFSAGLMSAAEIDALLASKVVPNTTQTTKE